jgi:hypothetical protein
MHRIMSLSNTSSNYQATHDGSTSNTRTSCETNRSSRYWTLHLIKPNGIYALEPLQHNTASAIPGEPPQYGDGSVWCIAESSLHHWSLRDEGRMIFLWTMVTAPAAADSQQTSRPRRGRSQSLSLPFASQCSPTSLSCLSNRSPSPYHMPMNGQVKIVPART